MNPAAGRALPSGHLDPCAQEFTPGPYSFLRAPPPPPPPPPPLYYSSYPLDGRAYVQSAPTPGSIPLNPIYNSSELGMAYSVTAIPQVWESALHQSQQQQEEAFRVGVPAAEVGPSPCFTRPYRYNNNINVNCTSNIQNTGMVPRTAVAGNVTGSSPGQFYHCHYQQQPLPFTSTAREHPSRTLLLRAVPLPSELSNADLRQQLERWGPVRALQTDKRQQGFVTVHYYDLRHAKTALSEIQEQHLTEQMRLRQHYTNQLFLQSQGEEEMEADQTPPPPPPPPAGLSRGLIGGKAIWAQYSLPVGLPPGPDRHNQGTLVVFNLDADFDVATLRSIFEAFGAVKELRETPAKRQHKFVEFFDVRDAARALQQMDGQEIGGKRVKIEFSRPGGQTRRRSPPPPPPPFNMNMNMNRPIVRTSPPPPPPPPPTRTRANTINQQHHLPAFLHHPRQQGSYTRWSNANEGDSTWQHTIPDRAGQFINGRGRGRGGGAIGGAGRGSASSKNNNILQNINNCNGGGGGGGGGFFMRRRRGGIGGQQVRSSSSCEAAGNGIGVGGATADASSKNGNHNNNDNNNNASSRLYSSEAGSNFAFDEAKAESNSSDARTTVMIKNIPNKYSQQMLLSMLDQHCMSCNEPITDPNEPLSAYDFVYLPIDFKNKCNLGYAFVNMTTSKATWKLYKAFHMQPWEAFNSRKICEVTYARVQGRVALEEHFRNSKFACDTDEYLPLVFSPPRNGEQLTAPLVMGGHIAPHKTAAASTTTHVEDGWDLNVSSPVTSAAAEPYSTTSKSYDYRNSSHPRGYGGHDTHSIPRRLQQQQSSSSGSCSTSRIGCA
ncbi:hypothetical protein SUGI_0324030 [Cryptomeria japonica]|uniref:protein terminal ear1 n=1 Tax=Cryptomeria japonica TaxID=3369 RepID=UPI002408E974|nr:protein terminal ear1 [Cryptomeria japonica]XP_057857113.2 protein terminal ear1 [Cryptomeria japonica]XP_057857114.2 protein terminal ear1 [Cryptomeria japonica]GLJ18311.1 hypothetical protein SUGI_0324030 [Cryptomeria japonica]